MGRKGDGESWMSVATIRATRVEYEAWKAAAREAGLSLNEWAVRQLRRAAQGEAAMRQFMASDPGAGAFGAVEE